MTYKATCIYTVKYNNGLIKKEATFDMLHKAIKYAESLHVPYVIIDQNGKIY